MSTDRRTLVIDADISRALAGLRQVDDSANRVGSSMGRAEASAARAGDTQRRATASATAESAKLNEQVDKVAAGFGKAGAAVALMVGSIMAADAAMQKVFTDRAVMTNLAFSIDGARESTMGLVSDMELARQAMSAKRLGLADTEGEFADLTEAAAKLGITSGLTAQEGISAIVEGLGRGSTEMLDNVGVTIRAAEAQAIYAKSLGISVNALTETQKLMAVKVVGMERVIEAAKGVTLSVNEQEQAWTNARQEWDELVRKTLPELAKKSTGLWQTLDEGGELAQDIMPLVAVALDRIGAAIRPIIAYIGFFAKGLAMTGNAVDAFAGAAARGADRVGEFAGEVRDWLSDTWVGDAASWARDTGESILKMADGAMSRLTEEIGEQIPWTKELASEWDIVRRSIVGTDEAMGELFSKPQEKFLDLLGKGKQLGKDTADAEAQRIEGLKNALIYAEHAVNLAEAQKRPAKDLEVLYQNQHMAKVDLLEATGKQAELEQQLRDEAVRQEKAATERRRRGGKGTTESDRIKAHGEIVLNEWRTKLGIMEAEASILFEQDIQFEDERHRIAVANLELEKQTLEAKRGGTAIEQAARAARIDLIDSEIELLDKQKERADQAKQLEFDKGAHEQRIAGYDREIERLESQKSAFQQMQEDREALTEKELEDLGVVDQRLLELQERRNAAALEYATIYQGEEAARQEQHDQEMARIEESKERWKSWDTLRKKQAENEKKRLDEQAKKQQQNVQAISGFLGQGQQFAEQVVLAGIKSDAKRERAAMRTNGIMALARAALETVEAVAAFARYDFVAGAAHTAAAVLGSITGFSLLAGRLPNGGGAGSSAGGSSGGAANGGKYQTTVADSNSSGPRDRPSTPASAEELTKIRGGYGSATTSGQANSGGGGVNIYNSTIVAGDSGSTLHHLDKQQAKRWGT
jgi:hypothetical protein